MEELFLELIRLSIGTGSSLTRHPSVEEWVMLYKMSMKQSLLGVCFVGVRRYMVSVEQRGEKLIIPLKLYYKWLGAAAQIQKMNEQMNQRCEELQVILSSSGFMSSILKGQGVAALYGELSLYRQPGDIDVWIHPQEDDSSDNHFKRVMKYVSTIGQIKDFNRQHVEVPFFEDTMVEIHFTPSLMNNPIHNKRLQNWFKQYTVVDFDFNVVYLIQHCYNHFLFEGIGLRQFMDYYFLLKSIRNNELGKQREENTKIVEKLEYLGLKKFAGAMMWVLKEIFHAEEELLICSPNKKRGEFLLKEILMGGNFGHYGNEGIMQSHSKSKFAFFLTRMRRNLKLLSCYPSEIIWSPYAMIRHYIWKQKNKV